MRSIAEEYTARWNTPGTEETSGDPSEPGSRTGNRKTTRKPKPILYRLRRFWKRLNWKRDRRAGVSPQW